MHFTKILHVCVILHVAFRGVSGAILRGRSGDSDPLQVAASESQLSTRDATLTSNLKDLNKQLDELLETMNIGARNSDGADNANIAERQAGNIQIPQEVLQQILALIRTIEAQINAAIASGGGSLPSETPPGGSPGPLPSTGAIDPGPTASPPIPSGPGPVVSSPVLSVNPPASSPGPVVSSPVLPGNPSVGSPTAGNPGPVVSSPAQSNPPAATQDTGVGPPIPSPFLTSSGAGNGGPLTTAYGTATTTGTRCKTTLTQTFTSYVYDDGSPAVAPAAPVPRSVDDPDDDDSESSGPDAPEEEPEQFDDLETRGEIDGTTMADGPFDWDPVEAWTTLKAIRRESRRSHDRPDFLFFHDEEDPLEVFPS